MPGNIGYRPGTDAGMSSDLTGTNWDNQAFLESSGLTYTAVAGDTVTAFGVWGDSTGTASMAIYQTSGGTIGARVGSAVAVSIGAGSQEHTAAASIALSAGTTYTVAIEFNTGADWNIRFVAGPGGAQMSNGAQATALPATWTQVNGTDTNRVYLFAVVTSDVSLEQEGFRFRNDDGSETTATWKAAQDTNVTSPLSQNIRLRALVNATSDPGAEAYTLRYKKSTDSVYVAVPTTTSTQDSISVVSGANNATSATTSISVTFGTAAETGDVVYLYASATTVATAAAAPSGWVNVLGGTTVVASDAHTALGVYHVVTSGENGNTTFTCTGIWSASVTGNVLGILLRNVDQTTPIDEQNSTFNSTNTVTPHVLAGLTSATSSQPTTSNALVVRGVSKDATGTYTTPATHTQRATSNTNQGTWLGTHDTLTTAGADVAATNITPSAGDEYASISVAFRREGATNNPIYISASANVTAGGEATTAQLTAPSGKTTSDFVTGRMWDDENGTDTINITTDDYTEVEWSLQAQSPAVNGDIYQFRVYAGATPLNTYTLTPEWTIGTPGGAPAPPPIPRRIPQLTYR